MLYIIVNKLIRLDRTGLVMLLKLFFSSFFFNLIIFPFVACGGQSWLHVSFLLHVQ